MTTQELRNKFYQAYLKWKKEGAEIWSDVNFPVETNFLSAIVKEGNGARDWDMPYPLRDVSNFVDVQINRDEYSNLSGLRKHNPLDDALASAYSLHRFETQMQIKLQKKKNNHSIVTSMQNSGSPAYKAPNPSNILDKDLEHITENQIKAEF